MQRQKSTIEEYREFSEQTIPPLEKRNISSYTYIMHGANTASLIPQIKKDYLFNPSYLEKVTILKVIGDPVEGFDHKELKSSFLEVKHTQTRINIILLMHGEVISGKYTLTTKGAGKITNQDGVGPMNSVEETEASAIIAELVEATYRVPLNIFVFSCYGANLQQFLTLLPRKSIMITLSDCDKPTSAYDLCNKNMEAMYNELLPLEFSIFDLLYIYCMSQTYIANTPIIGFFDKVDAPTNLKLSDFVPQIIELREKPSPLLAKLCELNKVSNEHLENLCTKLTHKKGVIEDIKPHKNLIIEIIDAITNDLNKIFEQMTIDPSLKHEFISASNMYLDYGFKGKNYNEDLTKLLSLAGDTLEPIKQKWSQKYYFNHQVFLQKVTFKVSDYRKLVEEFFQRDILPGATEQFASNLSEFEYNFPTSLTGILNRSEYTPLSSLPSYSLLIAKSVDVAKRYIHIHTQKESEVALPYPWDFDITGILLSSNDNPCLAPRALSGSYEELCSED